jgi:hypothetical protein
VRPGFYGLVGFLDEIELSGLQARDPEGAGRQGSVVVILYVIAAFLSGIALDYADSKNTLAVSERRSHAAAQWSVVMYGLGLFGIWAFVEVDPWLAVPTAAGLYAGSWLAVRPPAVLEDEELYEEIEVETGTERRVQGFCR